jgi:hypothetical protein
MSRDVGFASRVGGRLSNLISLTRQNGMHMRKPGSNVFSKPGRVYGHLRRNRVCICSKQIPESTRIWMESAGSLSSRVLKRLSQVLNANSKPQA